MVRSRGESLPREQRALAWSSLPASVRPTEVCVCRSLRRGLAVVVTPVAGEQPARPLELLEDRRFRERGQDADRRAIEAGPRRPSQGRLEGGFIVPIEAKHNAGLHGDVVPVDSRNALFVIL